MASFFLEGLIFGGLIYGGKFAFQNRLYIGPALQLEVIFFVFALFYLVLERNIPNTSPGGLIFGGAF